ncbi:MAG: hypothetical protein LBT36_05190 [Oscillospiraceae bacterium]|jgi:type II restriction enzyme|nr:hypothetical protein [Oscillospiraceae bacterium]
MANFSVRNAWLSDVLDCINELPNLTFTLNDMYLYERRLQETHPENYNVKAKIRQQLQFLRDDNKLIFLGNGVYQKII